MGDFFWKVTFFWQYIDIYLQQDIMGTERGVDKQENPLLMSALAHTSRRNVESTGGILGNGNLVGMFGVNVRYGRVLCKRKVWEISWSKKGSLSCHASFIPGLISSYFFVFHTTNCKLFKMVIHSSATSYSAANYIACYSSKPHIKYKTSTI